MTRPDASTVWEALGGVTDGDPVRVTGERGSVVLPALLTEMPDGVVWLPTNAPEAPLRRSLGVGAGAVVTAAREGGA